MKYKPILIALLMSTILCACAQAPENVKQQAEILDNSGQDVLSQSHSNSDSADTNSNIEYVEQKERGSLADIRAQLETDIALNNSRIVVWDAYVGEGEIMPTYDVNIAQIDIDNIYPLADYLFSSRYDVSDESLYRVLEAEQPLDPDYPFTDYPTDYDNDGHIDTPNSSILDMVSFFPEQNDKTVSVTMHSSGVVGGSEIGAQSPYFYQYSFKTKYGYDVLSQKAYSYTTDIYGVPVIDDTIEYNEKISYTMSDGTEWSIEDAIRFAQEFYNEQLIAFENTSIEFRVINILVQQVEEGRYGYFITMGAFDENDNYIDSEGLYKYDWEKIGNGEAFFIENRSYLWSFEKDKVGLVSKGFGLQNKIATDIGDDLISLSKAIEILDSSLAKGIAVKIPCAQLCYVVTCKSYNNVFEKWNVDKAETDFALNNYYQSVCFTECEFELRPMWVFKTDNNAYTQIGSGNSYFVDAKSGEMFVAK